MNFIDIKMHGTTIKTVTDIQETGWGRGLCCSESGKGQVAGSFEHSNEPSGSTICEEVSAPWSLLVSHASK